MEIHPINFGRRVTSNNNISNKKRTKSSLSDIEFNIVADTLTNKNYKNNVDIRLKNLRQNLNG